MPEQRPRCILKYRTQSPRLKIGLEFFTIRETFSESRICISWDLLISRELISIQTFLPVKCLRNSCSELEIILLTPTQLLQSRFDLSATIYVNCSSWIISAGKSFSATKYSDFQNYVFYSRFPPTMVCCRDFAFLFNTSPVERGFCLVIFVFKLLHAYPVLM